MKKVLALFISLLMIFSCFTLNSQAARKSFSKDVGLTALRSQFVSGVGPKCDDIQVDYMYYSPASKIDTNKYPLVIFLHGIGHGSSVGSQLDDSYMAYWSASELQTRFSEGGAYILLPRAAEEKNMYWGESYIEPLRAMIDDFIAENDNVDTTRIFISGSSQGGAMVWNMLSAYPEYFATAMPIASTKSPTLSAVSACSETSIWMVASEQDPIVNYSLLTLTTWQRVCDKNDNPSNCRLTTLQEVYNPDGTKSSDNHHLANVITYDLHTMADGVYPEAVTIDGSGKTVDLTSPNGIIKWISSTHSDFDGSTESDSTEMKPMQKVVEFFRNIALRFVRIIQEIFGL